MRQYLNGGRVPIILLLWVMVTYAEMSVYHFRDVLPRGRFKAEVLEKRVPAKVGDISQRMEAAVEKNKKWFESYIAQYKGQMVPYHRNFGITESEFQLIGKDVTKEVYVIDTLLLSIEYPDQNSILVTLGSSTFVTDSLHFDVRDSVITTKWGSSHFEYWRRKRGPAPLFYTGYSWRSQQRSPLSQVENLRQDVLIGDSISTAVHIGTLDNSEYLYLSFSVSHYGDGRYGAIELFRLRYQKK